MVATVDGIADKAGVGGLALVPRNPLPIRQQLNALRVFHTVQESAFMVPSLGAAMSGGDTPLPEVGESVVGPQRVGWRSRPRAAGGISGGHAALLSSVTTFCPRHRPAVVAMHCAPVAVSAR